MTEQGWIELNFRRSSMSCAILEHAPTTTRMCAMTSKQPLSESHPTTLVPSRCLQSAAVLLDLDPPQLGKGDADVAPPAL